MFTTGAVAIAYENWSEHFEIGKAITETCYAVYEQSPTGLGAESAGFDADGKIIRYDSRYILRPETVESIFYMWRYTHDQKYRDYGMKIIDAFERSSRDAVGYHDIDESGKPVDKMESFFLAETLKYLYLLFADDSVMPCNFD